MAFDAFLLFDGPGNGGPAIEGESTDPDFPKNIEILSFSWGASNPSRISSASGGAGGGKVSISGFSVTKKTDSCSPALFLACAQGIHYKTATVQLRRAGGVKDVTGYVYLKYIFYKVFVESVQWSGSSGGDDTPSESLSLMFGACKIEYTPQTAEGTAGTAIPASWSLVQNKSNTEVEK
jgi:type VI secretion system secreted protein Hcp